MQMCVCVLVVCLELKCQRAVCGGRGVVRCPDGFVIDADTGSGANNQSTRSVGTQRVRRSVWCVCLLKGKWSIKIILTDSRECIKWTFPSWTIFEPFRALRFTFNEWSHWGPTTTLLSLAADFCQISEAWMFWHTAQLFCASARHTGIITEAF